MNAQPNMDTTGTDAMDTTQDQDQGTVSVTIEKQQDGTFLVGMEPEGDTASNDDSQMQPARSINEALQMAKDMLTGPSPDQSAQAESDFAGGYNSIRGTQ